MLYESLEPGTEDDRMKGALWTLNLSVFGELYTVMQHLSADRKLSQVC